MWKVSDSVELYGIDRWGAGYFDVNRRGHVTVRPHPDQFKEIDIMSVVHELRRKGMKPPLVLRFPQIIEDRIMAINRAFENSIKEYEYKGRYNLIFPLKVNQKKAIVAEVGRVGKKLNVGMEVGTKAELLTHLELFHARGRICYDRWELPDGSGRVWSLEDELRRARWDDNNDCDALMALALALWPLRKPNMITAAPRLGKA